MRKILLTSLLPAVAIAALVAATGASALALDPDFGDGGTTTVKAGKGFSGTSASRAIARPGGGYLVAGSSNTEGYFEDYWMVTAFNADGRIDPAFGKHGRAMLPRKFGTRLLRYSPASAIAIQPDGRIVVGSTVDVATRRDYDEYLSDGEPDCNCSASRAAFAIIRLNANGTIDRSYAHRGLMLIRSVVRSWDEGLDAGLADIAVDARSGLIVYGQSTDIREPGGWYGPPFGLIYRLSSRGWIDKSFGSKGRVLERYPKSVQENGALKVGVDATGAITTVSSVTVDSGRRQWENRWLVRKYQPSGAMVGSYGLNGSREIAFTNPEGAALGDASIARDGTVTLGGSLLAKSDSESGVDPVQSVVYRLTPGGALDPAFGAGGVAAVAPPSGATKTSLSALDVGADGAVDLVETFSPADGDDVVAIRSLSGEGQTTADLLGDTVRRLPALGNSYEFWVASVFADAGTFTAIGTRRSDLVRHQDRITLMRVRP